MCGLITLFVAGANTGDGSGLRSSLEHMPRRGPGRVGSRKGGGALLGHRRLAAPDLDGSAAQPVKPGVGQHAIVFNGKIYNVGDLRLELEAKDEPLFTTSDVGVILRASARQGEAMLPKQNGMFAFGFWSELAKGAFSARDSNGPPPLGLMQRFSDVQGALA